MVVLGSLVTLAICGTVLLLGRTPERAAAVLVLVGLASSLVLQALIGFHRQGPVLMADLGLTAGFIVLAYRHRRAWLAVICLILIALLVVHASISEAPFPSRTFAFAVNGLDVLALAVLAAGAVAEARLRRRRFTPHAARS